MIGRQWHQLYANHLHLALDRYNHASTSSLSFLKARCSSCHQPTVSKHEVKFVHNETTTYSSFLTVLQTVNKLQLITGIWQLLWFLEFDTSVNESIHQHCLSTAYIVPCNTTTTLLARLQTWRAIIFSRVLSVSLSVCVCVSDQRFYPSKLTDFNKTWSQGPYSDLVWPRP